MHTFSLQHTDMPEEMRVETMELCVTACEKFATNNEVSVHCAVLVFDVYLVACSKKYILLSRAVYM